MAAPGVPDQGLNQLTPGDQAVITGMGGSARLRNRAAALGLMPGTRIALVRNPAGQPLLVRARGSLIALGRGEASRIYIRPLDS